MLAAAVLSMQFFVMGFAILLAKDSHSSAAIIYGICVMLLLIAAAGMLKKKVGWVLGWLLQVALMAYSVIVPAMAIINVIFTGLWVAAIVVGRKGEAARANLLAQER